MVAPHHTRQPLRKFARSALHLRNDALIIGPGGELVEAHATGDINPAIPEPIIGRIPVDPGNVVHASSGPAMDLPKYPVVVSFTPTSVVPAIPAASGVSAQGILATGPLPSETQPIIPSPAVPSAAVVTAQSTPSSSSLPSSTISSFNSMLLTSSVDFSAAAPTTPSQASSTAILSGSSMAFPPAASTSPSISGAKHGTNTSVAIAFGAVAVAAFLIAIVAWFVRIRARSRRRNISKRTAWPWDNGDQHLESVHGVLSSYEKDEESEGEAPSLHSVLTLPPELVGRDEIMHGTHYIPMPQSPYRLTGDLHKSVPDLAPDMGTLRVANYVPGDSRATSRLGMTLTGHPSSTEGPNPSLDDFAMLKQPWPSLRADSGESAFALASIDEKSDPYYFSSDMHSQGPTTRAQPPDSWVSSWKSNIMHAFQAVVSGSSSTTPSGDKYTVEPTRVGQASSRQQVLSRQNSVQSQSAISRHNSTSGHSVHGSNKDPSAWHAEAAYNRRDRSSDLSVPPLAIVKNRDRHCGTLSRASSVYSTASASCTEPALPISGFGLPQIPTSQSGSLSSLQHAFQGNDLDDAQVTAESVEASGWRRHRALSTSAHSVMSSLSRTASSQSEVLTDQEQYARGVLKERIHSISNVKLSGSDDVASHR